MIPEEGRLLIDGAWYAGSDRVEVRNAFDDVLVGTIAAGTPEDMDRALAAAVAAAARPFPTHARVRVLLEAADRLDAAAEEIAQLIALEGSKTIREARREPPRAAEILRLSAGEAQRIAGETLPFDARPGSENRVGFYERVPVGVVGAIQPFNDPLAVAAHKVGPALAAGNSVVLKPDSRTPFSVLRLAEILKQSGLPSGRLNVVTGTGEDVGEPLVRDSRVRLISFTGGVRTGERITQAAGVKRLVLELGANSAVLVFEDADVDAAAQAVTDGAFAQAGQNCLGVQRVLIHDSVYAAFSDALLARVRALKSGGSMDPETDVCPMISVGEAERVQQWIDNAVADGARVLVGGERDGALIAPTVLEAVPAGCRLDCDEVYGPVVGLYPFTDEAQAIEMANQTDFGLHAAVFTQDVDRAFRVARRLDVGAVIVNDSTDYRLDLMPFGGVKRSGIGREGIRSAVESMTETRVICLNITSQ